MVQYIRYPGLQMSQLPAMLIEVVLSNWCCPCSYGEPLVASNTA